MNDDDAKKTILARRARFVAAAVASLGIACGKTDQAQPSVCLSPPPMEYDAAAAPEPCLSPMPIDAAVAPDAATDAAARTTTGTTADAGAKTGPTPIPVPCLSIVRPKDPKKQ